LFFKVTLTRLVKIEDWFNDEGTIVKNLRKGRGRNPFIDSSVKIRLQVIVNNEVKVNNYPEKDPISDEPYDFYESENVKAMTKEEGVEYLQKIDGDLFAIKLDEYSLPSLMIKIIKSMKKNGVVEVTTNRLDKLQSNFVNEQIGFDQYSLFKEGDDIKFRITLVDCDHPGYFYKKTIKEKLEVILRMKGTATNFFKSKLSNNYKKAADMYQKINGYYNFGDATNNYAKEDATTQEYIETNKQL